MHSYYEEIRNRRSDYVIKRISKNGGVSEKAAKIYMNMYLWKNIYLQMVQKDNLIRIMICLSHFEEF